MTSNPASGGNYATDSGVYQEAASRAPRPSVSRRRRRSRTPSTAGLRRAAPDPTAVPITRLVFSLLAAARAAVGGASRSHSTSPTSDSLSHTSLPPGVVGVVSPGGSAQLNREGSSGNVRYATGPLLGNRGGAGTSAVLAVVVPSLYRIEPVRVSAQFL